MKLYKDFINQGISKEKFCEVYYSNNLSDTAKYFNTSSSCIERYCKDNGIKKTKDQISAQILKTKLNRYGVKSTTDSSDETNKKRSETLKKTFREKEDSFENIIKRIQKEEFVDLYINQNKSYDFMMKYYNLSGWHLDRLIKEFDCKKPRTKSSIHVLESKYSKYGSKEEYDKVFTENFKKSFYEKYGVSNPNKLKEVRDKIEATNTERYGVPFKWMLENNIPHGKNSSVNINFEERLKKNNIQYEKEFRLGKYFYDFKVGNILIELNPTVTHNSNWSPYGTHKGLSTTYHKDKTTFAQENGYRCINVWDWDSEDIIVNLLLKRNKVYARQCTVNTIDKSEAKEFIDKYHIQKWVIASVYIGLYYNNELVSVMTFGTPRYNKKFEYELIRYCSSYQVVGGAEKLFSYFCKIYNPCSIISYCDCSKFNGDVYSNIGFTKTSTTVSKHWVKLDGSNHITDNLLRQQGFDRLFGTTYGKGTSNEILMLENGFVEVYDAGQSRYEWYSSKELQEN